MANLPSTLIQQANMKPNQTFYWQCIGCHKHLLLSCSYSVSLIVSVTHYCLPVLGHLLCSEPTSPPYPLILNMITQEQLAQITPYFHHRFLPENFGNTLLHSFAYQRYTWKKRQAVKQVKCLMVNSQPPQGKNKVSSVVISIRRSFDSSKVIGKNWLAVGFWQRWAHLKCVS